MQDLPPASPADTPIATLGQLPSGREKVAAIYVPDQGAAYVFGGNDGGGSLDAIVRVNIATGEATTLPVTLPEARQSTSAVYVPEQRMAYIFGGYSNGARLRSIVAFAVDEPYSATTLSAHLTSYRESSAAVYAPDRGLAYIFGGETSLGVTRVVDKFDPFFPGGPTITQLPSSLWLPEARARASAVYASQNGRAYIFGGYNAGIQNSIFEIDFDAGVARDLALDLPSSRSGSAAVYSPETHLAYVLGGAFSWLGLTIPSSSIFAVELHDGQSYITQLDLPEPAYYLASVYASAEGKICTFGGHSISPNPTLLATIACFPVPRGPAVDIGRWENPRTLGAGIKSIAPNEPGSVWFATDGDGAWLYNSSSWTHYTNASTSGGLGTDNLLSAAHGDGYAWFGTQTLGARYRLDSNGIWASYRAPNLGSDWVRSIDIQPGVDSADPVRWFATSNGLSRRYWDPATSSFTWQTLRTGDGLADNHVWDLAHEQGATASSTYEWIATSYGAQRFRGGASGSLLSVYNGVNAQQYASRCNDTNNNLFWDIANDVVVGLDGRKWFSIAQSFDGPVPMGLCELSGSPTATSSWRPIRYDKISSDDVRDIAVDGEGRVWLATVPIGYLDQPGGASVLEYDKQDILYTWNYSTTNSGLRSNTLWAVGGTQERVYFGSSAGHVDSFAPRWNFFDPSNSDLGIDDFYDVWTALGRLWLRGSGNTLLWLEPDGDTVGSRDMGYGVRSLASDELNRLWVGTYQGGIHIKDGDTWSQLTTNDGLPDNRVFALMSDDKRPGWMWVGSEGGLGVWTGDRWLRFTTANSGLPDNQVRSLAEDRRGRIWMGTYGGGVAVYDTSIGWMVFDTSDGLADNYIGDLVIDGDGHVWADGLFTSGVSEWAGAWTIHDSSEGLPSSIQHLAVDELGRLWVGATLGAAVRQEGGWLLLRPANSGLAHDSIAGMAADGGGRIWFVHGANGGLSVRGTLNGPLGVAVPRIDAFSPDHGTAGDVVVITGNAFDARCGDSNEVLFGTVRAMVVDCSPTRLEVIVPAEARTGRISVKARNRTGVSGEDFTAYPTVTSFTPSGGHVGTEVIVHGTNFARQTRVCIGANCRDASGSPTDILIYVESGDTSGPITVRNLVDDTWDASSSDFTVLNISLNDVAFNQGIPSYELIKSENTLMQIFLRSDVAPPRGAAIEIDEALVEYQNGSGDWVIDYYPSGEFDPPLTPGAWNRDTPTSALRSLGESINLWFDDEVLEQSYPEDTTLRVTLRRHHRQVLQFTHDLSMLEVSPVKVLFVLVGPSGWGGADQDATRATVSIALDDLDRIFPRRFRPEWNFYPITWDDPIDLESDYLAIFNLGKELDDRRNAYNAHSPLDPVVFVFGILDESLKGGDRNGFAFWTDVSMMANQGAVPLFETLCNVDPIARVVFSLLTGDVTCDLDIPILYGLYTVEAGDDRIGRGIAHELGHSVGLVKPGAVNHDYDNISHSLYDEGDWNEAGAVYDPDLTLHHSPDVIDPVVNTITRTQILERPGQAENDRPKSLMSYVPRSSDLNAFLEPVDRGALMQDFLLYGILNEMAPYTPQSAGETGALSLLPASPQDWTGRRLRVVGTIDRESDAVEILGTEVLGADAHLTLPLNGEYTLALVSNTGADLGEHGLWLQSEPFSASLGYFAETLPFPDATTRIEVRHGAAVLASQDVSPSPPTVSIIAPLGGSYAADADLTAQWTASDADGGSLSYRVFYSADDGATWTPVGSDLSGLSYTFSLRNLPGGVQSRVRVIAYDGFNQGGADSPVFSVGKKSPQARIEAPTSGAIYPEGQPVPLIGEGCDPEDGCLSGSALQWSSDKQGLLGSGRKLEHNLSIGVHSITLRVQDSDSNVSLATTLVTILPDYDGDGLPDAEEQLRADEDPLNPTDGREDPDGDGLSNREEFFWGTNHNQADSDGDGRNDGQEVADGSDPNAPDAAPPPPTLTVNPTSLSLSASLELNAPPPQAGIQIVSDNAPMNWTASVDAPWLTLLQESGTTPAMVTLAASPWELQDGVYNGAVTINSVPPGTPIVVPVQLTVNGSCGYADLDSDGVVTVGDVQSVAARWGLSLGVSGFEVRYDLDRDGTMTTSDIARVIDDWRKSCQATSSSQAQTAAESSSTGIPAMPPPAALLVQPQEGETVPVVGSFNPPSLPVVRVSSPASVTVGEYFTVDILVDGFTNLGGFEFDLAFDPAVIQVQGVTLGNLLASTGRTAESIGPQIDNLSGTVAFGGYSYGSSGGPSTSGLLARITFRALAEGSSMLDIQNPLLADILGVLTIPVDQDGALQVMPGAVSENSIYLPLIIR